jgi:glucose-6-phosphate isomerase
VDSMNRLLEANAIDRLWERDGSLFSSDPARAAEAGRWMGWLGLAASAAGQAAALAEAAAAVLDAGITDVVLLGMGGSSLAPLVLTRVLATGDGHPRLHVMDTTSPWTVVRLMERLEPSKTLFVVSSKSGGTIEPLSLYAIFREWADSALGAASGSHFVAVTDPESGLEQLASKDGFAAVFHGVPSVGGRYSALSAFGMVPAALTGIDVGRLAAGASAMELACLARDDSNPAMQLAAWMVDSLKTGRDKLTLVTSERFSSFGLWVEQLVAESTGKDGKGIVPVIHPANGDPAALGEDRAVVILRSTDDELSLFASALAQGTPVIEVVSDDPYALGGEFVRWEVAVALASHLMGVDPFDQPNVAEAKEATSAILAGTMTVPAPQLHLAGIDITADIPMRAPTELSSLAAALDALLDGAGPGSYLAVLAYLPEDQELMVPLADALSAVSESRRLACCLELGPRYLHSTGQLHKAGPPTGRFLIITSKDESPVAVPGRPYSLNQLIRAQAEGDFVTLAAHGLPVVRVDLPQPAHGPVRLLAETLRGTTLA